MYGLDDRYRGVKGKREVVFVNRSGHHPPGLPAGQKADIVSIWDDGVERRVQGLHPAGVRYPGRPGRRLLPGNEPAGAAGKHGEGSHTPTSKFIAIRLEAASETGSDHGQVGLIRLSASGRLRGQAHIANALQCAGTACKARFSNAFLKLKHFPAPIKKAAFS